MPGGSNDSELETAAVFPPVVTSSCQPSKAEDSKWELPINVKDGENGGVNTSEGMLPENSTSCEASIATCGGPDNEGIVQICS